MTTVSSFFPRQLWSCLLVVLAVCGSLASADVAAWGKCGGIGYTGSTLCVTGYTCVIVDPYYYQCQPCGSCPGVAAWGQCGGNGYTGNTVCVSGYTCTYSSQWYSQCKPSTATFNPSPAPTLSPTRAPTRVPTRVPTLTPTVTSASRVPAWGKCGGNGYTGPTICVDGYICVYDTEWYSQCLPGTATTTNSPVVAPTAAPTRVPSSAPIATPTVAPTMTPSLAPVASPTQLPTAVPTLPPSDSPTEAPNAFTLDDDAFVVASGPCDPEHKCKAGFYCEVDLVYGASCKRCDGPCPAEPVDNVPTPPTDTTTVDDDEFVVAKGPCAVDSDCGAGAYCIIDAGGTYCRSYTSLDDDALVVASGPCDDINNKCPKGFYCNVDADYGATCRHCNGPCPGEETPIDNTPKDDDANVVVVGPCSTDSDCPTGLHCVTDAVNGGYCRGYTSLDDDALVVASGPCDDNTACPFGFYCSPDAVYGATCRRCDGPCPGVVPTPISTPAPVPLDDDANIVAVGPCTSNSNCPSGYDCIIDPVNGSFCSRSSNSGSGSGSSGSGSSGSGSGSSGSGSGSIRYLRG